MTAIELIKKLVNEGKSFHSIIAILLKYYPDTAYQLEERAAIKEYDGNIDKDIAEFETLIEYKRSGKCL